MIRLPGNPCQACEGCGYRFQGLPCPVCKGAGSMQVESYPDARTRWLDEQAERRRKIVPPGLLAPNEAK